ncbi:MAG: InlB B-repeat-containing protein, partial [Spirochaetaceae bacterium]|nr:InlB B-repeat-containing protein [Spirochaetaceae bacterium]
MNKYLLSVPLVFLILFSCASPMDNVRYYTITFDQNGASSGTPPSVLRIPAGTPFSMPDMGNMEKDGESGSRYVLGGWRTGQNTGFVYKAGTIMEPPEADITYYAHWKSVTVPNGRDFRRFYAQNTNYDFYQVDAVELITG